MRLKSQAHRAQVTQPGSHSGSGSELGPPTSWPESRSAAATMEHAWGDVHETVLRVPSWDVTPPKPPKPCNTGMGSEQPALTAVTHVPTVATAVHSDIAVGLPGSATSRILSLDLVPLHDDRANSLVPLHDNGERAQHEHLANSRLALPDTASGNGLRHYGQPANGGLAVPYAAGGSGLVRHEHPVDGGLAPYSATHNVPPGPRPANCSPAVSPYSAGAKRACHEHPENGGHAARSTAANGAWHEHPANGGCTPPLQVQSNDVRAGAPVAALLITETRVPMAATAQSNGGWRGPHDGLERRPVNGEVAVTGSAWHGPREGVAAEYGGTAQRPIRAAGYGTPGQPVYIASEAAHTAAAPPSGAFAQQRSALAASNGAFAAQRGAGVPGYGEAVRYDDDTRYDDARYNDAARYGDVARYNAPTQPVYASASSAQRRTSPTGYGTSPQSNIVSTKRGDLELPDVALAYGAAVQHGAAHVTHYTASPNGPRPTGYGAAVGQGAAAPARHVAAPQQAPHVNGAMAMHQSGGQPGFSPTPQNGLYGASAPRSAVHAGLGAAAQHIDPAGFAAAPRGVAGYSADAQNGGTNGAPGYTLIKLQTVTDMQQQQHHTGWQQQQQQEGWQVEQHLAQHEKQQLQLRQQASQQQHQRAPRGVLQLDPRANVRDKPAHAAVAPADELPVAAPLQHIKSLNGCAPGCSSLGSGDARAHAGAAAPQDRVPAAEPQHAQQGCGADGAAELRNGSLPASPRHGRAADAKGAAWPRSSALATTALAPQRVRRTATALDASSLCRGSGIESERDIQNLLEGHMGQVRTRQQTRCQKCLDCDRGRHTTFSCTCGVIVCPTSTGRPCFMQHIADVVASAVGVPPGHTRKRLAVGEPLN